MKLTALLLACLAAAAVAHKEHHKAVRTIGTGQCVVMDDTDATHIVVFETAADATNKTLMHHHMMHTWISGPVAKCTVNGMDAAATCAELVGMYDDDEFSMKPKRVNGVLSLGKVWLDANGVAQAKCTTHTRTKKA